VGSLLDFVSPLRFLFWSAIFFSSTFPDAGGDKPANVKLVVCLDEGPNTGLLKVEAGLV